MIDINVTVVHELQGHESQPQVDVLLLCWPATLHEVAFH